MRPSGPAKERQQQAFGPKAEKGEDFYFFLFFSNISKPFSNGF
jgi:hypothetical protein